MAVPGRLPAEVAALTEPFSVAARPVRRSGVAPGDVPVVFGLGPIGLGVVAVLKAQGYGPVVAVDFSAERRALAGRLETDVIDPAVESPYDRRGCTRCGRRDDGRDSRRVPRAEGATAYGVSRSSTDTPHRAATTTQSRAHERHRRRAARAVMASSTASSMISATRSSIRSPYRSTNWNSSSREAGPVAASLSRGASAIRVSPATASCSFGIRTTLADRMRRCRSRVPTGRGWVIPTPDPSAVLVSPQATASLPS